MCMKQGFAFFLIASLAATSICAGDPTPPVERPAPVPEKVVRERFLLAYQTAQTAQAKADTVSMLSGLKEKETLRLIAGMLGDKHEEVRRSACATMAATTDAEGYFVKPLMGALSDSSQNVRIAAVDAMSRAVIKADAIKALTYALMSIVGEPNVDNNQTIMVKAYDMALARLSGKKSENREARGISNFWMDYWKQNEETLRAEDTKKLAVQDPVRPAGLEPDSFDLKK
jgi:hypothetical protein